MKKLILSIVLSAGVLAGFSQITFIPKAGVTLSNLHFSDDMLDGDDKPKSTIGFLVGAGLELSVSENFAIQPELLFIQKGTKYEQTDGGASITLNSTLNYFELPVMLKVKFNNFYVNAGPSFSYGIGGSQKAEFKDGGISISNTDKIKFGKEPDNYDGDDVYFDNAFDLGVQLGAGVKVGPIIIDLRYGFGVSDVNDKEDGFDGTWNVNNRTLQLSVGFPIGGN